MTQDIEDVLAAFLEGRERGEAVDVESFVRRHPRLAERLRSALARIEDLDERLGAAAQAAPARVGPYRILHEIARGGSGRVFLAQDEREGGGTVALKLLDGIGALSERGRERFRREAQILGELRHPDVVRLIEAGVQGELPWIAMEHVEGQTLAALLARARRELALDPQAKPFTAEEAASIGARLARAVETVHAAGVLHRDIKPANVILADDGRVVLVDFGLVREEGTASLTRTGDLLGTPQYMAPEQARGQRADERSDVYGIGALLHELLTSSPPQEASRTSGDPLLLLERVARRPVRSLARRAPELPRPLARIVDRALSFRRSRRTPSARALAEDLEAFLAGRAVKAGATSLLERLDGFWLVRRGPVLWVAGALLALAASFAILEGLREQARARREVLTGQTLGTWIVGDDGAALESARRLVDEHPGYGFGALLLDLVARESPSPGQEPAAAAAARGWAAVRDKRYDEGFVELRLARELSPSDPVPIVLLARAAELAEQLELAAREYRAAVERLPGEAGFHARLSAVHYARRDDAEAERAIRSAIELAPQEPDHHFSLARVLSRRGEKVEGLAAARRGAELAGENVERMQLQILAALLDGNGEFAEARVALGRVLERRPDDPQALYNMAHSYMLDHHLVEAVEVCQRLARTRDRSKALATLAWIHAGSNLADCEECKVIYARHPELLDAEVAEREALEALAANDSDSVPMVVAQVAKLIGRPEPVQRMLEEHRALEEDDRRIALFERALRMLRKD